MLSVVIPARNAADTLAETLDSLLAQTRRDWEAIVVDDGSTDSTKQIAETYVGRDRRFRLLSDGRPPEGASAARNRGIAEAKGRWLLFLDSDDWIQPAFIGEDDRRAGGPSRHQDRLLRLPSRLRGWQLGPSWLSADIARAPFEVFARGCPAVIHSFVLDRALVVELGGFDRLPAHRRGLGSLAARRAHRHDLPARCRSARPLPARAAIRCRATCGP